MTSTDASFQSLTGALESAEPGHHDSAPSAMPSSSTTRKGQPPSNAGPDSVAAVPARPSAQRALNVSNVSASPSPNSSRDASPAGHQQRTSAGGAAGTVNHRPALRSRKSSTEASPSRGASSTANPPSAAAIQRALSATNIPQPTSTSTPNDSIKGSQPTKPNSGPNSGDSTPRWPISPRLRSPPPEGRSSSRSRANSIRNQIKKPEAQSTPAIVVQSSSPASVSRIPVREETSSDQDEPVLSMKTLSRGASGNAPKLETVQESSQPATPGIDGSEADSFISVATAHKTSDEERNDVSSAKVTEDLSSKHNAKQNGSGSDTTTKKTPTGKMQEQQRSASAQRPHHINTKPSLSSLSTRSATQPSRNMTVETETVPSVAQSAIGNTDRSSSSRVDGSLRLKPSNETIRPKKERKAPKRKAPSINAGTASTKADVFEQHVANEVNDADSSDSEATFIYDSNQPEQQPHRSRLPHSRTPSMTSIASLADPRLAIRDSHKNPGKKNSMKFTNQYNNPNLDADADRSDGTIRLASGRVGGGSHHHHIGRHGQGRGTLSHLALDSDSSKAQSSRARGPSSRQVSQPNSPRYHTFGPANGHTNGNSHANGSSKFAEYSTYDMDMEHVADDERTPLIPTRSPRVRTPRRRNSMTLRFERRHRHSNGLLRRFAGCLVLTILLLVVMFSFVGLIIASTKPLINVKVQSIQNVVASQEELMLDLVVDAVNPNIIGVTVSDMDISIFANSKHVGSDKWWRHHGSKPHNDKEQWRPVDDPTFELEDDISPSGIDEGTDPIESEPRTMSLGRLFHFDSPLNFEGSWWARKNTSSIGEIRLLNPGNKTEAGGTERWIEVLQYPFEIIVRGTIKYQLPLSNSMRSDAITAKYSYDPDTEKKKIKVIDRRHEDVLHPTIATSKPVGRYNRQAAPLLTLH